MPGQERISNNYFDGLQVTGRHKAVFFIIMVAYFCEQMDNWNFGFIAPALMQHWGLTMRDIGTVTFWYFAAMTCGGFVGGFISDLIGRRKTFLIAITLFSTASIINGLTDDFHVFVASRALTGFGVFCLMVCSQAYIAEMAPAESRGKWQNLVAGVGFCAVPVIGMLCRAIIPLHEEAWRYIFYLGGMGYIALFIAWKYLDESPRWLVSRGRIKEAEEVMLDLTHMNIDLSEAASKGSTHKPPLREVLLGMISQKYVKRTLVILVLVLCTNPATFVVTNWTATLLKAHGFTLEECLMATTLISIGVPLGLFASSAFTDMGGRKIPLVIMLVVMSVLAPIFGNVSSYWVVVGVGALLTAFAMGLAFTIFSYTAESYPTHLRNTATGFHSSIGRLAVAFSQPLIPVVYAAYSFDGVFYIFSALCVVPAIVLALWGAPTGGKSLEDIA
ncbi:MAG: MFS transporter [Desulfovibrio sp. MES5]|uniref:MFS transporter n=1 Tax=Desulfovibrio sp. MES5 TaxID=1899016 RepID=UPI000B9C850D|nr:MFS transporter [Desulfovibrio sp. MES5]OXS27876.1 MAG: MFS transporter [Desulfovibrio sp. MES5]